MQRMVHSTELVALITSIVVEGFSPSNISHCFPFALTAEPSVVAKSCLRSQRGTFDMQQQPPFLNIYGIYPIVPEICVYLQTKTNGEACVSLTSQLR